MNEWKLQNKIIVTSLNKLLIPPNWKLSHFLIKDRDFQISESRNIMLFMLLTRKT